MSKVYTSPEGFTGRNRTDAETERMTSRQWLQHIEATPKETADIRQAARLTVRRRRFLAQHTDQQWDGGCADSLLSTPGRHWSRVAKLLHCTAALVHELDPSAMTTELRPKGGPKLSGEARRRGGG